MLSQQNGQIRTRASAGSKSDMVQESTHSLLLPDWPFQFLFQQEEALQVLLCKYPSTVVEYLGF